VLGTPPELKAPKYDPSVDDHHILRPPSEEKRPRVEIMEGRNILPPPEGRPVPADLAGRVVIAVGDDISTGDMAPDGMIGMSLWSNIPECAKYMFRRQDPSFPDRALEWGGGIIVAGHNYGQGSSREQAALCALHLGIRAVIAKSFARIHWQNLIAQGILPLLFENGDDYDERLQGQMLRIRAVRQALTSGIKQLVVKSDSGHEIPLLVSLLPREAQIVLAGGTIKYLKQPGR
jgi:aconitate hydratase